MADHHRSQGSSIRRAAPLRNVFFLLLLGALLNLAGSGGQCRAEPTPARPQLWVVDPAPSLPAEQALLASVQGLLNRDAPRVWVRARGLHARVLERVASRFEMVPVMSCWTLIASNRSRFDGFLTCTITNHTLNLATSLAGPRNALVMDSSLRSQAIALGLREVADLRQEAASGAFDRFQRETRRGLFVHQPASKPFHLRDLAVSRNAWVGFEPSGGDLSRQVRILGPDTEVMGWGNDEHDFVSDTSRGGGWVIPADWALNLSAHRWIKDPFEFKIVHPTPAPARPGQRIVTFVISDGDNVQWLLGGFSDQTGFWASPRRGTFPVTWELAPRLAELAPAADAWLRRTATPFDAFIGGPSGGGYYFPHASPDRPALARRSAEALAHAGLRVTSVLNSGGEPEEIANLLADPRIDGVLYKDYAPYHLRKGAVTWHHQKPAVAYRYLLWEQKRPDGTLRPDWLPDGVAQAIATTADDPTTSLDAFSVVQVHAWSFRSRGGPMEAIHETLGKLPPNTRVVTAPELIQLMRELKYGGGVKGR